MNADEFACRHFFISLQTKNKKYLSMNYKKFKIRTSDEFIQLTQLLKATNVVENGALAQVLVTEGLVKRDGEVELRKRAKIRRGEKIEVEGFFIEVE